MLWCEDILSDRTVERSQVSSEKQQVIEFERRRREQKLLRRHHDGFDYSPNRIVSVTQIGIKVVYNNILHYSVIQSLALYHRQRLTLLMTPANVWIVKNNESPPRNVCCLSSLLRDRAQPTIMIDPTRNAFRWCWRVESSKCRIDSRAVVRSHFVQLQLPL